MKKNKTNKAIGDTIGDVIQNGIDVNIIIPTKTYIQIGATIVIAGLIIILINKGFQNVKL